MPAAGDNYQLTENTLVAGYEREIINGTDPELGRNSWIGQILNINFTEDYGHQDFQPLGSGPDPHFVLKKREQFSVEIELNQLRGFLIPAESGNAGARFLEACSLLGQRLGDVKPVALHGHHGLAGVFPGKYVGV